jgi:MBG domain-containing protein/carboxypeptidase family protein/Big-like domain-containing protein
MRKPIVVAGLAVLVSACLSRPFSPRVDRPHEQTLKAESRDGLEPVDVNVRQPEAAVQASQSADAQDDQDDLDRPQAGNRPERDAGPHEHRMQRGRSFDGDVRSLPYEPPERMERPEHEQPLLAPSLLPGTTEVQEDPSLTVPGPSAAIAPPPSTSFEGLDFANWGAGHPPDTNGDVGPQYFIQTINTSIGIFDKTSGLRVAAFTFNTFSAGHFGNLCDTNNFGDPVVVYDSFEDRWVITDFAFKLSGGNPVAPSFQCVAVSKSGDPVSGGWNFYSIQTSDGFADYPKFGVWPDGIYMTANMFPFGGGPFMTARVWSFNKAQMYAGAPTAQVVSFDVPGGDFTVLPSNARLQTGTPPPGRPNFFVSTAFFLNALTVYKFHADWNNLAASTFTGPDTPAASSSWPNASVPQAPSQGGNNLDTLGIRAMMQNQYTNIGGAESLWTTHTVRRQNTSGFAAPRWYQTNVTGGAVAPNLLQSTTWDPDAANLIYRFMPSLAVDRAGDMALGYSTSNSTTKPAIKYAGRLASDPINTFSQTEQVLILGTGTQVGNCGSSACTRWGDYSAMTLDPDGCTFWYTNMYYQVDGLDHHTRIGSFTFPGCTPVGNGGTLAGTITAVVTGNPIAGALVALGSRTTLTDSGGHYTFDGLPAGTYPVLTASAAGFLSSSATSLVIGDAATTTRDLALASAPASACFVDTTLSDFQTGIATNCDLIGSPGDIVLSAPTPIDQQNTTLGGFGVGINTGTFGGQTFTAGMTGQLLKADINLFCAGCSGTTPNLTLSVRATSGGLPTGPDLTTATIPGFSSGAAVFYAGTFSPAITVTAGTQYALVIRPVTNRSAGTYALTRSGAQLVGADVYAGGTRVSGPTAGTVWSIPLTGGISTDAGFHTYVNSGFVPSGTFVSSLKDANAANGATPTWGAISWSAATPAGTNVQFQVAASNSAFGPFNFVGPDGTAATVFANGGSLAQFNGNRYLRYKAVLTTSSSSATPTLNDVTICFNSTTALTVASASAVYGGTVTLSATLTAGAGGVAGKSIDFALNGTPVGSAVTDGSGLATLSNITLPQIAVGSYTGGVAASFAGDAAYAASSGSGDLTITAASLVAKADDKTKIFDAPNPVLTGTVTGVQYGDNITAAYSTTAVTTSPPGTYPIVPSFVDPDGKLGNYVAQTINGTLSVLFEPGGSCDGAPGHQVLPPLDAAGGSVFNPKRTVPVKFRICDVNGISIGTPGTVTSFRLVQVITGTGATDVDAAPVSTTPDTSFRWDPTDQQWIFNLATKDLAANATYVYQIGLVDGSTIGFRFALK